MRTTTLHRLATVSAISLLLSACGGGAGNANSTAPTSGVLPPNALTETLTSPITSVNTPVADTATGAPAVVSGSLTPNGNTPVTDAGRDFTQAVLKTGMKAQDRIGANLSGVSDYAPTHEFVDLVRQSRGFGPASAPWASSPVVRLDSATGWPTEDFGMVLMVSQASTVGIDGTYTIRFKAPAGATVSLIAGSSGSITSRTYNATTGEHVVLMNFPVGGNNLFVSFTNTQGRLTDLKVIRPGYDTENPPTFTNHFLQHIGRFSTLRFMDWAHTNSADVATRWADRPTPINKRGASQNGVAPGIPWETAIELANVSASDMWINIPVGADADYVRQLARLIKQRLAPNLKVYVEYSNEVWNSIFPSLYKLRDASQAALTASPKTTRIDFDGSTNQWHLTYRYYTERSMEMSDVFRSEFPAEMMTRIRPVLAWQAAGILNAAYVTDYPSLAYGKLAGDYFWGYAIAPYFGMNGQGSVEGMTVDEVLNALNGTLNELPTRHGFERHLHLAKKNKMQLISYEGGPDTTSSTPANLQAKAAANRHNRMYDMCQQYLNTWAENGGGLFMWFQSGAGSWVSQYGTWALTESMLDTASPKLRCMDWAATTQAPQAVTKYSVGELLDMANIVGSTSVSARTWWNTTPALVRDYLVGSPSAACYRLTINATFFNGAGPTIQLHVNGTPSLTIGPIPRNTGPTDIVVGNVCLDKGPNALTFKAVTVPSSGQISTMRFDPITN